MGFNEYKTIRKTLFSIPNELYSYILINLNNDKKDPKMFQPISEFSFNNSSNNININIKEKIIIRSKKNKIEKINRWVESTITKFNFPHLTSVLMKITKEWIKNPKSEAFTRNEDNKPWKFNKDIEFVLYTEPNSKIIFKPIHIIEDKNHKYEGIILYNNRLEIGRMTVTEYRAFSMSLINTMNFIEPLSCSLINTAIGLSEIK